MVKLKQCSLNCGEVCSNFPTFPSGERGPREAVNVEDLIVLVKFRKVYVIFIVIT